MTMLKKININSTVKVKLNEYGIQKLKKEYAYKTIDDGVVKLQSLVVIIQLVIQNFHLEQQCIYI